MYPPNLPSSVASSWNWCLPVQFPPTAIKSLSTVKGGLCNTTSRLARLIISVRDRPVHLVNMSSVHLHILQLPNKLHIDISQWLHSPLGLITADTDIPWPGLQTLPITRFLHTPKYNDRTFLTRCNQLSLVWSDFKKQAVHSLILYRSVQSLGFQSVIELYISADMSVFWSGVPPTHWYLP